MARIITQGLSAEASVAWTLSNHRYAIRCLEKAINFQRWAHVGASYFSWLELEDDQGSHAIRLKN